MVAQGTAHHGDKPKDKEPSLPGFVTRLPTTTGKQVKVAVREVPLPMVSSGLCRTWVEKVHDPFIRPDPDRADRDWDWKWQIPILSLGTILQRRPHIFQLCLEENGFPIAMVALLERERWIADHRVPAVYVWYLTGAPATAVQEHGSPKLITAAALDIAIIVSLEGGSRGHLWLHAAPEGGDRLLRWYANRGLDRVSIELPLPGPRLVPRQNDGRYFWLRPEKATVASGLMEEYR